MRPEIRAKFEGRLLQFLLREEHLGRSVQERFVDPEIPEGEERTDADQNDPEHPGDRRIERDLEQPEEREQDRELRDRQDHQDDPCQDQTIDVVIFSVYRLVCVPWFVRLV